MADVPDDRIGLRSRREARERALGLLYEAEMRGVAPDAVLDDLVVAPPAFTTELVRGVADHARELDAAIEACSRNWRLDRMAALDRALLRMATFELLHRPDVPPAAAISEAIELAKRYSTEESGRFVNGVLAAVAERGEVLGAG